MKTTKFLTGLALLFLFACQEQEIQQLETEREEQFLEIANFSMRAIDSSEISSGIVSRFIELNSQKNKSTRKENGDDLEIDWDNGNYMQLGSQHSYTFAVFPKESDNKLRNIVYVSLYIGGYHEYLYTYDLTVEELQLFNKGDAPDLSGKITIEFLRKLDKLPNTGKASGDCGYKGWVGTDQYGIKRIYTHKDNCEDNIGLGQCKWEDKTYSCPETLDDGNSNNNNGGGGSSSDSGSSNDPIIFIPRGIGSGGPNPTGIFDSGLGSPSGGGGGSGGSFSAPLTMTKAFYLVRDLGVDNNSNKAKWLNQNQHVTDIVYKYILTKNKSTESIEFSNWAIDFMLSQEIPCGSIGNDCVESIEKMAEGLRKFHGEEGIAMAEMFETFVSDFNLFTKAELQTFYDAAKSVTQEFNDIMLASITGAFAQGSAKILGVILFEVGGNAAVALLQKIPVSWVLRGATLTPMIQNAVKLGVQGAQTHVRLIKVTNPLGRGKGLFNALTKNAISKTTNAEGTIVANMGNGNFITYRTVSSTNFPATINFNFQQLLGTNNFVLKFGL